MNIDPSATVCSVVAALPSSVAVLRELGISDGARDERTDERTLEQACTQAGVSMEKFLNGLDRIDWNTEP